MPDSPGTRGLSLSAEPRADGWQRPLAAPPPCCCTVGSFQAVWKTKQVSFAKGHRPKHRAVLAACFFSHRLPLSLNRKILDKGLGRHLSPRCHCWPRTVRGAGSASSARQAGLQHGDGARNKRENKVKPKKKKKKQEAAKMREMTDTNAHKKNPNRQLVSTEVEHMEKEKNLLLPQPECLHNCHFQFYIIPFPTHLFHV